ncbi:MAG: DUF1385 domain-containing protein [Chloroflexi bacterium]|nr:DUF1385 domain-containing protein [Chloroflexota bacterium]
MSTNDEAPALPRTLGGQAVIEGVMIRGPQGMAVCVRKPDGELAYRTEENDAAPRFRGVPILRGVSALGETLTQGMRAMVWSAQVAAGREPEEPSEREVRATTAVSMGFALALFMLGPAALTRQIERRVGSSRLGALLEGVVRTGTLVGYLRAIGRLPQVQRVFGYHGAEHRAIQAYEADQPLEVESLRRFPNAHVRCGTSFLLTTSVVSSILYAALGPQPMGRRLLSRLALTPLIAGLSYEAIRLGSEHPSLAGWLFRPNLALQALTTRDPDDGQMEVALAALRAALALHRAG